jgi:ABC-2 type transport system permease protein
MVLPLFQMALMRNIPASELNDMPAAILAVCQLQNFSPSECMQGWLVNQFLLLFLLIPLAVPVTIASYSIVGEKSTRSLEPLLATPTSTTEIIIGKALASVIPAISATWLAFVIFLIGARLFAASDRVYALFMSPMWFVVCSLSPLVHGALRQCRDYHLVARQRSACRRADRHAGHAPIVAIFLARFLA